MLKKIKITILCIFVLIFVLLLKNILAFSSYCVGKYYYSKQNYFIAKKCFTFSKDAVPKNVKYNDFYTRTLTKVPLDYKTQKELFELTQDTSSNPAALVADNRIEKFKNATLKHFENNYISAVVFNNKIIRWDEQKFPLKVYIDSSGNIPAQYVDIVYTSFAKWDEALNDFFKFKYVNSPEEANIIIDFKLSLNSNQEKSVLYVAGQTSPVIADGNRLKQMYISFNLKDNLGVDITPTSLSNTATHEIGHALGIMGHSNNNNDLMYMQAADKISPADINTVKLLYLIVPDISNTPIAEMNTNARFYGRIVVGSDQNMDNEQYSKAISYINKAPDISAGWVELATFYYQIKNYPKAIKALLQAKRVAMSNDELYFINYNLAMVYLELKEYNNALIYIEEAQLANQSVDLHGLIGFIKYKSGDKTTGIAELHEMVERNPKDTDTGLILADIYLSEMDFLKTISVLKWLTENNPGFKQDPRLRKYKILNLFV